MTKGSSGEAAIIPGSVAEKAGLKENDIILQFNGATITVDNSLARILQKYNPGETVSLTVMRNGKENTVKVVLGERTE